jgi:hypothetical protein
LETCGVRGSTLKAMAQGARLLGFIQEVSPNHFLLLTVPPLESLTRETVETLQDIGAPLWPGNTNALDEVWPLYVHFCGEYRRVRKKLYIHPDHAAEEVDALIRLARRVDWPQKIMTTMSIFLEEHSALGLGNFWQWRRFGPTLLTFIALYERFTWKLEAGGVEGRNENELVLARGRKRADFKRYGRGAAPTAKQIAAHERFKERFPRSKRTVTPSR